MPTVVRIGAVPTAESYIEQWRLLATFRGDQHVVGRFSGTNKYWSTLPIARLDTCRRVGLTRDGQFFQLVGEPGSAREAKYFVALCAVFDQRLLTTRDVTREFFSSDQ